MRDDNIVIDYTYLWDIVSQANKELFTNGLNLVILDIVNNDITNNVSLICPTNPYTSEIFDINKNTLILIKNENYYEPIYVLEDIKTKYNLTRTFDLKSSFGDLRNLLEIIKTSMNDCRPLQSMPTIYKFKQNISAQRVANILVAKKYEIHFQIMNYNGKIIGLIAEKDGVHGFVPVFPSNSLDEINIKFMDDDIWESYPKTIVFLNRVYEDSNERIACKTQFKVIDDNLIVGILTSANQFVSINPPKLICMEMIC